MTSTEKDILLHQKDLRIAKQQKQIDELSFQVKQFQKLIFGSKRERTVLNRNPAQGHLFENTLKEAVLTASETTFDRPIIKKSRKGVKRNKFPANLERTEQVIYPEGYEAESVEVIGEDVTEILMLKEVNLAVKIIRRPICKSKEQIIQAPIPARIIQKGMVDESVIAHIINEKVQHHTPLYRQTKKFKQQGLSFVKKSNIENWFKKGVDALVPLYNLHEEQIMKQDYLQVDESSIKVLSKNKPGSTHRGQMWVANAPDSKAVLFKYDPSRSMEAGSIFLDLFSGSYLQSDGYSAYEKIAKLKQAELIYCAAHARRKFKEALDKKEHPKLCEQGLLFYQELYALERSFKQDNLDHDQRLKHRKQLAVPIFEKFKAWLEKQMNNQEILPDDRLGKAITYTYKRWDGLKKYCEDGRLEIDNNLVENTIRPLALGRKNYLFAGSDYGAQNLAICYSLVNTCLKNNINPSKYLCWVLKKIAANKVNYEAVKWLPQNLSKDNFHLLKI